MGRYAEYGLDDTKRSQDQGRAGAAYCPWCEKKVSLGYSMCFANWVICLPCIIEGLKHFDHPGKSKRIKEDACFKQKKWGKEDEIKTLCFMSKSLCLGLSKEELNIGFRFLSNNLKVDKHGQLQLNF